MTRQTDTVNIILYNYRQGENRGGRSKVFDIRCERGEAEPTIWLLLEVNILSGSTNFPLNYIQYNICTTKAIQIKGTVHGINPV